MAETAPNDKFPRNALQTLFGTGAVVAAGDEGGAGFAGVVDHEVPSGVAGRAFLGGEAQEAALQNGRAVETQSVLVDSVLFFALEALIFFPA